MPSIRITQFAGLVPEITGRNIPATSAQIAHNCLLTDGSLRPQARWVKLEEYTAAPGVTMASIAYDPQSDKAWMYATYDPVTLDGAPFASGCTIAANMSPPVVRHVTGNGLTYVTTDLYAEGVTGTVSYERAYLSNKPVNRVYACSRVRIKDGRVEEGPMVNYVIGDPTALVYEGDSATLNLTITTLPDNATHIRLYRSISGLDTGEEIANQQDSDWHLIATLPIPAGGFFQYVDGGSITTDPLDVFYANHFHAPILLARHFALSESGWFVAVASGGDIAVSERYLHHAWPIENSFKIPETVTDAACCDDNMYIGTNRRPYILSMQQGEKGLQGALTPFPEPYRCLPNTMTPTPSGVIYASNLGLIALSREGQRILTASIANAGDELYSRVVDTQEYVASIHTTIHGVYHNGWYYGFCGGAPSETFF